MADVLVAKKLLELAPDNHEWRLLAAEGLAKASLLTREMFLLESDVQRRATADALIKSEAQCFVPTFLHGTAGAASNNGQAGADAGTGTAADPKILQQGSLHEGEIFVSVLLRHDDNELKAELLLDTGCDMDINISDYKADQLGLPAGSRAVKLEMGQASQGPVRRRGAVQTALLLEGEGDEVLEDPLRSTYLEVWTDVGSSVSHSSQATPSPSQPATGTDCQPLSIKVLSPIQKGKDRHEFDAILGSTGMARLRLGINKDTGRLYVKKRTAVRRI